MWLSISCCHLSKSYSPSVRGVFLTNSPDHVLTWSYNFHNSYSKSVSHDQLEVLKYTILNLLSRLQWPTCTWVSREGGRYGQQLLFWNVLVLQLLLADEHWWMNLLSLLLPGNNPCLPGKIRLCLVSLFPFPSLSSLILRLDGKYVIGGKH